MGKINKPEVAGATVADESAKETKRRVKNPETFRERAIKATEEGDKPKRVARVKHAGKQATSPVFQKIGAGLKFVFYRKPFIWLRRPIRIVGKVLVPPYIRNSWKELRLVTWPSWNESRRLTVAVLIFAVIFGVTVAVVDYGLDKLFREVLLK